MPNADAPAQTGPAAPTAEHPAPTLHERLLALVADGDLPAEVRATAEAAIDEAERETEHYMYLWMQARQVVDVAERIDPAKRTRLFELLPYDLLGELAELAERV